MVVVSDMGRRCVAARRGRVVRRDRAGSGRWGLAQLEARYNSDSSVWSASLYPLGAAEELGELDGGAHSGEGVQPEDVAVLEHGDALVGVLVEERIENGARLLAVLGEDVALLHVVGPLPARERGLVEGDVADEVERVVVGADLLAERLEEDALLVELLDDGGLLVGFAPAAEKVVEALVGLLHGRARVVLERLRNQLAVGAVVLDALRHDGDGDAADDVLADARLGLVVVCALGVRAVEVVEPLRWRRRDRLARLRLEDDLGLAVERRVGEELGGLLEVEDREPELAGLLVDARAAADDLLELDHRLDALVEDDDLAGLRVHAGGEQLRGRRDDGVALLRVDEVVE